MKTSVVRRDGSLTIPAPIRRALHLEDETPVVIAIERDCLIVRPWRPKEAKAS